MNDLIVKKWALNCVFCWQFKQPPTEKCTIICKKETFEIQNKKNFTYFIGINTDRNH